MSSAAPLVAIVGRPNVGKSTLFNRLVGGRPALVDDQPGITRDRRYGEFLWCGKQFRLVDTGGIESEVPARPLERSVVDQALRAVDEADLVLFLVDGHAGLTAEDRSVAARLRRTGKPVLWVANKVDHAGREAEASELYELGADQVIGISSSHGRNIGELCDAIAARLPDAPPLPPEAEVPAEPPIQIALVGRPNAGKSSLTNRLLGEERVIVDAMPGTTRDSVDTELEFAGRRYCLIDTAGIRRRARVAGFERVAVTMAEQSVERADIAVLVIDGIEGVAEQEAKIAGMCEDKGRGLVVAFNKSDLLKGRGSGKKLKEELERKLQFVPWAKVVSCSAKTGQGIRELLATVEEVYRSYTRRISTGELNRFFATLVEHHPPSLYRGQPVKLYYITQAAIRPPAFVLSVNHPEGVHFSYRRYLSNRLRQHFGFVGTPLKILCRGKGRK